MAVIACEGLTDVPWFAALGNHDLGDSDLYATCPEKAPRVVIGGQAYASNQLDASKGGYRTPHGNTTSFHLPDFNYRATLNALNLEIYGLDQNYQDAGGRKSPLATENLLEGTDGLRRPPPSKGDDAIHQ